MRDGFPNEACGLLATLGGRVMKVYPMRNAEESPITYRLDSGEQLRSMTEIEDNGWDLGAIFHSHTRTRAYPSPTDVRLALYPETLYVIISLAYAETPDIRAFRIEQGNVAEESIEVVE